MKEALENQTGIYMSKEAGPMFNVEMMKLMENLKEIVNVEVTSADLFKIFKEYDKTFNKKELYGILNEQEYIINSSVYFKFVIKEIIEDDNYVLVMRNYKLIVE